MAEPKVRFKRDDGSEYPVWRLVPFKKLSFPTGIRNKNDADLESYSISNEKGFVPQSDQFEDAGYLASADRSLYYVVSPGSFVYNPARINIGSIGYQNVGKDVLVSSLYEIFNTTKDLDDEFLLNCFRTKQFQRNVRRFSEGGVRQYFYYDKLCMVNFPLPCLEEQQKIADFLSSLDGVIKTSEEEVENLETQKKAVMKKVFSQEVRIKKKDGSTFSDWKEKQLGDIADVSKLAGFEFTKYVTYSEKGNIIAIRGLNVKQGRLILNDVKYLDGSDFSKLSRSKLYKDDIMFTYVGTIGDAALVPENNKYYMAPNVCRIRVKDEDPCFIMQQLLSDWFKKTIIHPLVATSSQPALSMESIRLFKMNIPCLEEQHLIAGFLSDFDEAIETAKKELELWKELKKGLLQQMFV